MNYTGDEAIRDGVESAVFASRHSQEQTTAFWG